MLPYDECVPHLLLCLQRVLIFSIVGCQIICFLYLLVLSQVAMCWIMMKIRRVKQRWLMLFSMCYCSIKVQPDPFVMRKHDYCSYFTATLYLQDIALIH